MNSIRRILNCFRNPWRSQQSSSSENNSQSDSIERSVSSHDRIRNSRSGRIPGWADQEEKRAEFDFEMSEGTYHFLRLHKDELGNFNYIQFDDDYQHVKERARWKVGIACSYFRVTKALNNDTFAHWGVYISRDSELVC
jgi:hypothetical protein